MGEWMKVQENTNVQIDGISCEVIRSRRKTMALQVYPDGRVVMRVPSRTKTKEIDAFLRQKRDWLRRVMSRMEVRQQELSQVQVLSETEVEALRNRAAQDLPSRTQMHAQRMGVSFGKVTIRLQKSRWGSCSAKGNISLNALLMLAPEKVRDYVVIHELCHRRHMNHSPAFWDEVERWMPDYRIARNWLKKHGDRLMRMRPGRP